MKQQRMVLSLALTMTLLIALLGARPLPVRAASFVVDIDFDDNLAHDTNPGDGTCADSDGWCTLRAAIEETNALAGADIITFSSAMTITLDTGEGALPQITEQLTIDASSVWDTGNDRPGITIDGAGMPVSALNLRADHCEIYGLFVTNFHDAIRIYDADYATIGGAGPGQRNVLSGNSFGVEITQGAHNNKILANWIGLSVTGDTALPNTQGVFISGSANNNYIGYLQLDQGNYISGNTWHGVYIQGSGTNNNYLYGNVIGLPAIGSRDVGNGGNGVYIESGPQYNQVGAGGAYPANTISGNGQHGVYIEDANGNQVEFGTITANTLDGVRIDGSAVTSNRVRANSIHDNGGQGIALMNGSHHNMDAPTITGASPSVVSGTYTCGTCLSYYRVDIYSDRSDEGGTWHDYVTATVGSDWTYSGTLVGPYVTVTATDDRYGETSEFSSPERAVYYIYLPLVLNNYP